MTKLQRLTHGLVLALFLSSPALSFGLSEEVFDCEQQARRLHDCCDVEAPTEHDDVGFLLRCFDEQTCSPPEVTPIATIQCLEQLSCNEVRNLGLCEAPEQCVDIVAEAKRGVQ